MGEWICICGSTPCSGLDCGVSLRRNRKKPDPKRPEEIAAIRAAAWKTRREKYGSKGHQ